MRVGVFRIRRIPPPYSQVGKKEISGTEFPAPIFLITNGKRIFGILPGSPNIGLRGPGLYLIMQSFHALYYPVKIEVRLILIRPGAWTKRGYTPLIRFIIRKVTIKIISQRGCTKKKVITDHFRRRLSFIYATYFSLTLSF